MTIILEFEKYLEQTGKSEATIKNYVSDVKIFLREGGWKPGEELATPIVKEVINAIYDNKYEGRQYSSSSLSRKKYSWNAFCDCIKEERFKINKKIKKSRIYQENVIEINHVQKMIDTLNRLFEKVSTFSKKHKILRQMVALVLGINESLRASEYQNLVFGKALKDGVVEVKNGKNGDNRKIPLTDCTKSLILKLKNFLVKEERFNSDKVFESDRGFLISTRTFQRWMKQMALLSGVPRELAKTHGLRHRFARNLYTASNNDLNMVSKTLGHESIETTKLYIYPTKEQMGKTMNKACKIKIVI